ncbi:MAG: TatD family hydrolase [bacterium]|nr:TatD family hydrolase [bacterium]
MFDAHTHAHFAAFEKDYKEVTDRALKAGVGFINVGTQIDTSRRAVEVAHEFENHPVYATVGLHPTHTEKSYHDAQELGGGETAKAFTSRGEEFNPKAYLEMARDPKVVAIGECGIDYYRVPSTNPEQGTNFRTTKEKQTEVFRKHIEVAQAVNKPLMIHCRPSKGTDDAYEDILAIITNYQFPISKIMHFYVGSPAMTKKFIDAGFNFTFGGVITFSRDYDEQIKMIPDDRILLETDAPYVAPQSKRGQRNEPAYVIEVAKKMAEIRGVSYNRIEEIIKQNAKRVFGISV